MTQIPGLFTRSSSSDSRQSSSLLGILGALGPAPAAAPSGAESRPRHVRTSTSPRMTRVTADERCSSVRCGESLR